MELKRDDLDFSIVILAIILTLIGINWKIEDLHKEQMQKMEEIKKGIQKRNHLDSLYWEHLENCAFIHKDSIGVGYQGYLYDKYYRKYVKK